MGLKYRLDRTSPEPTTYPNGSREFRTADPFASLAKVECCPCEDGVRRTAFATAEPDTFFSIPACVYVSVAGRSKTVGGFLALDEDGWRFVVAKMGANAALIKKE